MYAAPAIALGAFAVFGVGYLLTNAILTKFEKGGLRWTNLPLHNLTEKRIDEISKNVGGLAAGLIIILMLIVPKDLSAMIWLGLTILGIIFGLFTFVLFSSESNAKRKTELEPTESTKSPPAEIFYEGYHTSLRSEDNLYQILLAKTRKDIELADRFIEFERKRTPNASREELIRNAIVRWERDNR
jgi:hypothetical protein